MLTVLSSGITYGLPVMTVEEISKFKGADDIPGARSGVIGTVSFRGQLVPVVDLRTVFGKSSLLAEHQELVKMLELREKDHLDWVNELVASIKENREFKKTTDPTKCAFGQWFYSFKTHDTLIQRELKAFEAPHNRIHALAATVQEIARKSGPEAALAAIDRAKETDLRGLVNLFALFKTSLLSDLRQIAVIVRGREQRLGILVDTVMNIKRTDLSGLSAHRGSDSKLVLGTLDSGGVPVYVLDVDALAALYSGGAQPAPDGGSRS